MIVSSLRGGLGNQFFQYATGRALARRRKTELVLDVEWFNHNHPGSEPRTFELYRYRIQARTLLASERKWIQRFTVGRMKRFAFAHRWTRFKEPDFNQYYPSTLDLGGNVYLDGYWQYPDYFADCEDLIRAELVPSAAVSEQDCAIVRRIKEVNSVSIHVRRGDYLTSGQFIGVLPLTYYTRAITWVMSRVKSPHFFVFSDDSDWVRANFLIDAPVEYVVHDGADAAFKDLHLMAQCQHHIIANSSFSWWAAWLCSSESPLVLAPMRWFAKHAPGTHSRLPPNWVSL